MADKPIGKVTHYFDKIGVAVVKPGKGAGLKNGDSVQFKGGERDFTQAISSLQVGHKDVEEVKAGDDFGLKVDQAVKEGDEVFAA